MLALTRRAGETFYIGDDIKIKVVRIGTKQVRIGIEAPKELNIVREELLSVDEQLSKYCSK